MDGVCAMGKSIQDLSDTARMWGSQILKSHKIYLLSISIYLYLYLFVQSY